MKKRILSVLLCLCMALVLLPTTALAETPPVETVTFGYAYDAWRDPDFPAQGDLVEMYSFDKPIINDSNERNAGYTGSWTLTRSGTYSYVKSINKNSSKLDSIVTTVASKYAGLDKDAIVIHELKDGASIAIPNDGSNETRALLLLQDAGLIKLKDGIDPTSDATKLDITENPKNLDIQEIAAEQLPRSLADVDLAVINGNSALQADLNAAEDSLITENPDYAKVYVNVVACRSGEENSDKIQALKKALQSDDVKKYVDETYKGAVVTVF